MIIKHWLVLLIFALPLSAQNKWLLNVFCDDLTQCDYKLGGLVEFDSKAEAEMWIDNYPELGASTLATPDGNGLTCFFTYLDPDPNKEGALLTHRKHFECMTEKEYENKYCVDGPCWWN